MKKTRSTESQIVEIPKALDSGTPATELALKHGIHVNTIRLWRDKYAGMQTSDLVRMKQLEAENVQMRAHHRPQPSKLTPSASWSKKLGTKQRQEAVPALHAKRLSKFRACALVLRASSYHPILTPGAAAKRFRLTTTSKICHTACPANAEQ